MPASNLTIEELKALIRETVLETLEELLDDPDKGREIRPEIKQQLITSLQRTQAGERGIPAAEVAQKLGLTW